MSDDNKKETFGLTTWSVNNRKTVFLIAAIILLGGLTSYLGMPKENFPEIQIPEIYIGVAHPGNSPKFMEDKITEPIEKELNSIKEVEEIRSNSIHGYSSIQVEFKFGIDITDALNKVKDAVDEARAKKDFPKDLPVEPNIFEMDISEMPIMNINLSGDYSIEQLKDYAEILEEKIEDLPEISEVDIRGIQEQEMQIEVDRLKAESMDVSFGDIESAVSQENIVMSGGELLNGNTNRTIRIDGEFKNAKEIEDIIVKQEDNDVIYLKNVATVKFADADTTSYARQNGQTVVMLDVKKRTGENLLDASTKIDAILAKAVEQKWIPESVKITKTNDQSDQTRNMVSNLENSIILGVILVVTVLLFFLGLRNALFVGIAIPLSMFMSFGILSMMGVTLNTMVLFSLVLALGMLVDNGIVVIENVYRLMDEEGMDPFKASIYGVGEVAWPIIASTATTLAAFIPLAIWPGLMGEFMKYLPITLMIVLGSSLFVALVINPVVTAVYMKVGNPKPKVKRNVLVSTGIILIGVILLMGNKMTLGNLMVVFGVLGIINLFVLTPLTKSFQNKFLPILENLYEKFITFTLSGKNPIWFLLGTVGMLVVAFILMAMFTPKVVFFPDNEPQYVNIFIQHPIGTDIKKTNETTLQVEEKLNVILEDYLADTVGIDSDKQIIQSIIAQVGEGTSDPSQGPQMGNTPHKARITISFTEFENRGDYKTSEILEEIREGLKNKFPADVQISAAKNEMGPPQEPPINIEIKGEDMDYKDLILEAEKIRSYLMSKNVPGVEQLKLDVESGKPELPIVIDRDKARRFNTSTSQIASAIRTALFGRDISTFKEDDETYDITVRFDKQERNNLDALLDQKLIFRNNKGRILRVPIRSVVKDLKPTNTYSAVVRKDLVPVVTIYSNVTEDANANEVVEELKSYMGEYETEYTLPEGMSYTFTGQQEDQAKEMAFLSKALLIAVFLILLIIVTQFNSYSTPSIILSAVFFSLIGVLLGLVFFQMDFVVIMTMIGIISLAGIVVNNAIVLIDYTNLIRKRKREELGLSETEQLPMDEVLRATILGGRTRLRPVLLTAITTILGLFPLAIGLNINFITLFSEYDPQIFVGGDNALFFGPMSWTIIFGLTFATFLTLVIVPVMYILLYRFKLWIYKVTGATMRSNI